MGSLRNTPGTYVLLMDQFASQTLVVGRLGRMPVGAGLYAYVGSAFGPGGVQARVARHWAGTTSPHWHIDYLRAAGRLCRVWHTYDTVRRECAWAEALRALPGASVPLRGFGASDCGCSSHLVRWPSAPSLAAFREQLRSTTEAHAPIYATSFSSAPGW